MKETALLWLRLMLTTAGGILPTGALLFGLAGTCSWPGAWWFLGLCTAAYLGGGVWLSVRDPGLLRERLALRARPGQTLQDRVLLAAIGLAFAIWILLMGWGYRCFGVQVPAALQVLGGVLGCAGFFLYGRVLAENSFASNVVGQQRDRGQHVVETGPYALVRHPLYAAFGVLFTGCTLLTGSLVGLAGVALLMAVFGVRIIFEERFLTQELPDYAAYTRRVRWRLLPWLW